MKNFLNWSQAFNVGIEEIDQQHQNLADIVNGLYLQMKSHTESDGVGFSFDKLDEYIRVHFSTEEKWMVRYAYPDYLKHKKLHLDFAKKVLEFKDIYASSSEEKLVDLAGFLKNWFTEHVVFEDHKFGEYLKTHMRFNLVIGDNSGLTAAAPEILLKKSGFAGKLFQKIARYKG